MELNREQRKGILHLFYGLAHILPNIMIPAWVSSVSELGDWFFT